MKNSKIVLVLFLLLFLNNCKKSSDPVTSQATCQSYVDAYNTAIQSFATDPTNTTKCQAVKSTATALINGCSAVATIDKTKVEAAIKTLPCQ